MVAADVEHLAETISGDKPKLRTHCELGELHDQTQQGVYERKTPGRSMRSRQD